MVDGDTVVVLLEDKSITVRLIGVDCPESIDPRKPIERFAHEASAFVRGLVDGKMVRVEYEPAGGRLDKYGRLLAYLYLEPGERMVNREIIRQEGDTPGGSCATWRC